MTPQGTEQGAGGLEVADWAGMDEPVSQSPDSPDALRLQLTFFRYDTVLLLFLHELREDSTSFLTRVR